MSQDQKSNELIKQWNRKLKDSGFEDIEDIYRPGRPLKDWHSTNLSNVPSVQIETTLLFYQKAGDLLHWYKFKSRTHRRIWELFCEGFSKREIEEKISKHKKKYKRENIGNIINAIARDIKFE